MEKPLRATELRIEEEWPGEPHPNRHAADGNMAAAGERSLTEVNRSVVLIAPNESLRRNLRRTLEAQRTTILHEYSAYPSYGHLPGMLEADGDAFIIEIDSDIDIAMDLVEAICARKPSATVMVYSISADTGRMVRSMRAGSREYLSGAIAPDTLQEALARAAGRHAEQSSKKLQGKAIVFWGAKGGSGATTLATNFAIALHAETAAGVALLDLNPDLGDVALLLGITPRFTLMEALRNAKRLDQEFISTLVMQHSSGISVLASSDAFTALAATEARTIGKLVDVFRNQYAYVVIDAGRGLGDGAQALFQMASTIYLVTQLDIPSLRAAQRFRAYAHELGNPHLELVVNRYDARRAEFSDEKVSKALGQEPRWRIPNDFATVSRSLNTGTPLILEKSPVAQTLRAMARMAAGKPPAEEKRKGWGLFR